MKTFLKPYDLIYHTEHFGAQKPTVILYVFL